jgi:uncharacterized membrane protein
MDAARILRHMSTPARRAQRVFDGNALDAIEAAIAASERSHGGQIRFAVEAALDAGPLLQGQSARERALEVFSQLRVWDTEHNNGVLIYVLLADHDVEIVADRGIHVHVGAAGWERICQAMEAEFRAGCFAAGVLDGIEAVGALLAQHFPATGANEQSDRPVLL